MHGRHGTTAEQVSHLFYQRSVMQGVTTAPFWPPGPSSTFSFALLWYPLSGIGRGCLTSLLRTILLCSRKAVGEQIEIDSAQPGSANFHFGSYVSQ